MPGQLRPRLCFRAYGLREDDFGDVQDVPRLRRRRRRPRQLRDSRPQHREVRDRLSGNQDWSRMGAAGTRATAWRAVPVRPVIRAGFGARLLLAERDCAAAQGEVKAEGKGQEETPHGALFYQRERSSAISRSWPSLKWLVFKR